jgi:hypothetical protein
VNLDRVCIGTWHADDAITGFDKSVDITNLTFL